ncbi:MAG: hypothetical protein LBT23_12175 [Synergistaceae bacterium]|jgi:hypothetical protein|nr:hypothetical protein [Synergistaceae bacterium]
MKRFVTELVIKATGGGVDKKYEFSQIPESFCGRKKCVLLFQKRHGMRLRRFLCVVMEEKQEEKIFSLAVRGRAFTASESFSGTSTEQSIKFSFGKDKAGRVSGQSKRGVNEFGWLK